MTLTSRASAAVFLPVPCGSSEFQTIRSPARAASWSEKDVRSAQKMQVGPCVPVRIQLKHRGSYKQGHMAFFGGFWLPR